MPRAQAHRALRLCCLALLCAAGGVFTAPQAGAGSTGLVAPLMDKGGVVAVMSLLESSVGHLLPEFDDNVRWLGKQEGPTFESLRGSVVVLNTWDSATTDGRNMTHRVRTLLSKFGDDVKQVALHTPDEAEEIIERYDRYNGKMPVPLAVDTKGAYLDELGIYKTPRIIVVDRQGRIAHAGVSLAQLREAVQRAMNVEDDAADAPTQLPARAERVTDETPAAPIDAEWPQHNRIQAGNANNLQGRQAPQLVVEKYMNAPAPDTEGKVVMMEFWATWCGPCIRGIPHLNELQASFPDDLVIVGISAEDEQTVLNKMRTDQRLDFGYTVAIDPSRRVQRAVGNRGIPHCIVVSGDGIVRWQGHPASLTNQVMGQIVEANRGSSGGIYKRWVQDG